MTAGRTLLLVEPVSAPLGDDGIETSLGANTGDGSWSVGRLKSEELDNPGTAGEEVVWLKSPVRIGLIGLLGLICKAWGLALTSSGEGTGTPEFGCCPCEDAAGGAGAEKVFCSGTPSDWLAFGAGEFTKEDPEGRTDTDASCETV